MIIFGVQSLQNKAVALEEQVNTASSDIKVQEKRRVDLVYNLADCVKQYDKHEAEKKHHGIVGVMIKFRMMNLIMSQQKDLY